MLEALEKRAALAAARRAAARRERVAERIGTLVPGGAQVSLEDERVAIEGPGLVRRFVTDPTLRWRLLEVRDE